MWRVHDARDRILLEGEEQQASEDELNNEVFALPEVQDSDQGSANEEDEGSEGETPVPVLSKSRSRKKIPKKTAPAGAANNSSEDDRENQQEESWGRKKSVYYSTNAAQIDSDDEEAQKLEEAEVLRLQTQARDALDEADFGLFDAPSLSKDALEESVVQYIPSRTWLTCRQSIGRELRYTGNTGRSSSHRAPLANDESRGSCPRKRLGRHYGGSHRSSAGDPEVRPLAVSYIETDHLTGRKRKVLMTLHWEWHISIIVRSIPPSSDSP